MALWYLPDRDTARAQEWVGPIQRREHEERKSVPLAILSTFLEENFKVGRLPHTS